MVKIPPNKILSFEHIQVKIDIADADTSDHVFDLSGNVPPNCVMIILFNIRVSGTGALSVYPNSLTNAYALSEAAKSSFATFLLPIVNQEIKYVQSVASDDWDLYILGYFIEGTVKSA